MTGHTRKRPASAAAKTTKKKVVKKAVTKQNTDPARRATATRTGKSSVVVVVLSGSTPLRRNKAAELVAEELQLDLSKVNLSSVVSQRVGETEKNINRVFDDAERSGSILFFDGADALFGKHRPAKDGASRNGGRSRLLKESSARGSSRRNDLNTGCSKRLFSKAAANKPEGYPQGYVEGPSDARTRLIDFSSIL
ncbi:MAG: AAA family ATPase [Nitrospira sp. NTP1]|nr:AAA family ATPase [Nitrospira sp. NTP1]